MPAAVRLREDYSAEELRSLAQPVEGRQSVRGVCLALAAVREGQEGREEAARIGGMDRQTLEGLGACLQQVWP